MAERVEGPEWCLSLSGLVEALELFTQAAAQVLVEQRVSPKQMEEFLENLPTAWHREQAERKILETPDGKQRYGELVGRLREERLG